MGGSLEHGGWMPALSRLHLGERPAKVFLYIYAALLRIGTTGQSFFRGHRKHPDRGYHPHGSLDLLSAALAGSATSQHLTDLLSQRWPDLPAPLFDYVPSTNMLNSGLWRQWLHYMFFSLLDLAHA